MDWTTSGNLTQPGLTQCIDEWLGQRRLAFIKVVAIESDSLTRP